MAHPLQGIKVLDLSRVLAGPWCTQTLADLGAEVWKIEEPTAGDDTRSWTPPDIGGESTYFLCCNRSKESLAIDLKSPEGRTIMIDLVRQADVLVENFRLGALDRIGLGYEDLRKFNPRLIYCSISGYGRSGSRAEEAGYDFAIQAESGLMSITGEPNGTPMKVGVAITDIVTGMNATQAILAALIARSTTGEGQHLDIALFDSAIALLANVASSQLATANAPKRYGNAHPTVVPYQLMDTQDGVIALAVGNDSQFRTLCARVLGQPELAEDSRFVTNRERSINRDVLIPLLASLFEAKPSGFWLAELKRFGIPAGAVRTVQEALSSPEATERAMVVTVADRLHGELKLMNTPLKFSSTPTRFPKSPPRLGENTREVLERLGVWG